MSETQRPKLTNWSKRNNALQGIVTGHPKIADGTEIRTSRVLEIDEEKGWAKTLNSEYDLENQVY